jgi:hypothetical protein
MDLNNNLYYFFIDKNYRLFNLKYSKEVFLDKDILLKIIKQIANKYKILKYELYFKDTSLELNKYFSVVYYYGKTKLSKNLFKSYKSFQNISINSEI